MLEGVKWLRGSIWFFDSFDPVCTNRLPLIALRCDDFWVHHIKISWHLPLCFSWSIKISLVFFINFHPKFETRSCGRRRLRLVPKLKKNNKIKSRFREAEIPFSLEQLWLDGSFGAALSVVGAIFAAPASRRNRTKRAKQRFRFSARLVPKICFNSDWRSSERKNLVLETATDGFQIQSTSFSSSSYHSLSLGEFQHFCVS